MTNEHPVCGTDIGLPSLADHLDDMQRKALRIEALLDACTAMYGDEKRVEFQADLIETANEIAKEMNDGLDGVVITKLRGIAA